MVDFSYELDDRFRRESGSVYLSGNDALVRLPLEQAASDKRSGLHTAGFISGYRGSPLGTYDMALERAKRFLESADVRFEPGVNEDLAATAVWGSQQVSLMEGRKFDGIFALWYGKGPGVDRSCDALKHGNFAGSSTQGGVLVVAGDDAGAKSSSLAHQSEPALVHCAIPVLCPADVQEVLDFGLYGWAMSRFSGAWVGLRCGTDTVESAGTVQVGPNRIPIVIPEFQSTGDRFVQWSAPRLEAERTVFEARLSAVRAFVAANGIDKSYLDSPRRRLGIVTTGKAYLEVRQALDELGVDQERAANMGLAVYKVGMSWPLEESGLRRFAHGREELLVVEEKRPIIEDQIATILYNDPERPALMGKRGRDGTPLLPAVGETSTDLVARAIAAWLSEVAPGVVRPPKKLIPLSPAPIMRKAAYCSGCPHNTSTMAPEGSVVLGGIGCHGMAVSLADPSRRALAFTHMGGEGANWIGMSPFTEESHVFQNVGDGTFFHSALLAVRAAVAADVNITYKVLANGAVAMTGGQEIEGESIDANVEIPDIVNLLAAEGVGPIAVLTTDTKRYRSLELPKGTQILDWSENDALQRRYGTLQGVSAIVYDKTCAAEARRLRKRGLFPDPDRRVVINEAVCEGCGDCGIQSNCIAIEPLETEFGRKRVINQSGCNKDYSCLNGYCPAFAIIEGGSLRRPEATQQNYPEDMLRQLPDPEIASCTTPYNILITGVGGTGVVTVGALLGTAALLDGSASSVLDLTGMAQKNGAVSSHLRIAAEASAIHSPRLGPGSVDLLIGCDLVVSTSASSLDALEPGRTTAILNLDVSPTADFASHPDLDLSPEPLVAKIRDAVGQDRTHGLDARVLVTRLVGDEIATNIFLVGFAAQKGLLPVSIDALERAIELNNVAVAATKRALAWGRIAGDNLAFVLKSAGLASSASSVDEPPSEGVSELVSRRVDILEKYQNRSYAQKYSDFLVKVSDAEKAITDRTELSAVVAKCLFTLMAYKDEYEVARLYTDGTFSSNISDLFEGKLRVKLTFAPQRFFPVDRRTGRVKKKIFGPWIFLVLTVMARFKAIRGTWLDVFGRTEHRRRERTLIVEYMAMMSDVLDGLSQSNYDTVVDLARWPELVKGFGVVKDESIVRAIAYRKQVFDQLESLDVGADALS